MPRYSDQSDAYLRNLPVLVTSASPVTTRYSLVKESLKPIGLRSIFRKKMNSNINIKDVEERSNDIKSVHARCYLSTVRATSTPAYTIARTVSDLSSIYRAWLDYTSQGRWNDLSKYMHSIYNYNRQDFDTQTFVILV